MVVLEEQFKEQSSKVDAHWKRSSCGYLGTKTFISEKCNHQDDGVDYTHPSLAKSYSPEHSFNFVSDSSDPLPDDSLDNKWESICFSTGVLLVTGLIVPESWQCLLPLSEQEWLQMSHWLL